MALISIFGLSAAELDNREYVGQIRAGIIKAASSIPMLGLTESKISFFFAADPMVTNERKNTIIITVSMVHIKMPQDCDLLARSVVNAFVAVPGNRGRKVRAGVTPFDPDKDALWHANC